MKFTMIDGTEVAGKTYKQVVQRMASEKLVEPRSLDGYRRATAGRVKEMYGFDVDATTDRTFMETMVATGLIKRLS